MSSDKKAQTDKKKLQDSKDDKPQDPQDSKDEPTTSPDDLSRHRPGTSGDVGSGGSGTNPN